MSSSMVNEKGRRHLPPYISYRTFWNFIYRLQQGIPARVDRSYWGDILSGSSGVHLMATLRYLGLIDAADTPTNRLRQLAYAKNEQKAELLKQMISEAFGFLLVRGSFDLQTATYAQLQEIFYSTFQTTPDVSRKCIKFFVALGNDAGIPLSPFITKRFKTPHSGTGTRIVPKRAKNAVIRNLQVPENDKVPNQSSWKEMLLGKFPTFDPSWSDEVKVNWFKAFDVLLKSGSGGNGTQ